MKKIPNEAIILSAGYGKRMLPLTSTIPKPLAKINGEPILHKLIKKLRLHNVNQIVVNTHYLGYLIEKSILETFDEKIEIIFEKEILETGGGVLNAINKGFIGNQNTPFFVVNGDIFWVQREKISIFEKMYQHWDMECMDILIVLNKKKKLCGYDGDGDFNLLKSKSFFGLINRDGLKKNYVFTGIQLVNPKIFNNINKKVFSFNELFDLLIKKNRLFGLVDKNDWFHLGTVEHLRKVEKILEK